ncbi:hypothetical protein HYH03_005779 [Edaphochlamys debaryana]|uniref:Ankyrin repeat domain-containing protein n=1 Tax=Edaphochlamys debaryana TaxID=47281 RepID=A0A836C241_9CHLO|nr:hypothetical protein HYH03_005779 [Edaphochlamys debaryana]|eukprot:KAG2496179.1 hypothetical protein HYH03_005779 [Edaphochlamys debaryana]
MHGISGTGGSNASQLWIPELVDRIASFMPGNDVACILRLVDHAAAAQLQRHATIHVSQPVPPAIFAAHWSAPDACRNLTLTKRRLLVCLTAASGVVENLAAASQAAGCRLSVESLLAAVAGGRIDICCRHLLSVPASNGISGALAALPAAGRRPPPADQPPAPAVLRYLECCDWLVQPGRLQPTSEEWNAVMRAAAHAGNLSFCCWVHEQRLGGEPLPINWSNVLDAAAGGGSRAVCEWCLYVSNGSALSGNSYRPALAEGHVALSEWLHSKHSSAASYPSSSSPMDILAAAWGPCDAATFRRLCEAEGAISPALRRLLTDAALSSEGDSWRAKVEILYQQGGGVQAGEADDTLPERIVRVLADGSMVERLIWIQDRGIQLKPFAKAELLSSALAGNNAAAVAFLLRTGAWPAFALEPGVALHGPPDPDGAAADGGPAAPRLQVLPSWDDAVNAAAHRGHVEALRLALEAGCPINRRQALLAAASGGCIPAMQLLLDHCGGAAAEAFGPQTVDVFAAAAGSGSVEAMVWVQRHGWPAWSSDWSLEQVWLKAAESGCEAALVFIAECTCPLPRTGRPYSSAEEAGDLQTLTVLRRLGVPYGRCGKGLIAAAATARLPLSALQLLLEDGCEPESWQRVADAAARCWAPGPDRERLEAWVAAERQPARQQQRERRRAQKHKQQPGGEFLMAATAALRGLLPGGTGTGGATGAGPSAGTGLLGRTPPRWLGLVVLVVLVVVAGHLPQWLLATALAGFLTWQLLLPVPEPQRRA